MTLDSAPRQLIATVDVRELNTLRWGPIRQLLPMFAERIELARYVRGLLQGRTCQVVEIQLQRGPDGRESTHVFEIFVSPQRSG